jgi:hypothetical protein
MPHAESNEMLIGFRQVAAYRAIIRQIARSANGTLVWGGIMLGLWFMIYANNGQPKWDKMPVNGYIHLAIGVGELLVGLWKKFAPSPIAFLMDAFVLLGFAAANGWRAGVIYNQTGRVDFISVAFGVYMLWIAYQQFQNWVAINRALIYRPNREQLARFDELVRDVRRADPEANPNALDLPTRPGWRALLLGDIAFFVASTEDVVVCHRNEVEIEVEEQGESASNDRGRHAMLYLPAGTFGPFPLDAHNARNYLNWKSA